MHMIKSLFKYVMKEKVWWILPPILLFVIIGVLIAVSSVSPVSPFLYMFF